MTLTLELLFAICLTNVQNKDLAACKSFVQASVITYKQEETYLDKVERNLAESMPTSTKTMVIILSSLQNGKVYVPLIHKEW